MTWTRVSTTVIHEGPFLGYHQDTVVRPDGVRGTYEHVVMNDAVRVVALNDEGVVTLVEDHFYLQGRPFLQLPGGGTDGEDPYDAAPRELAEETGLTASRFRRLGVVDPLPGATAARVHLFVATGLRTGAPAREATEVGMKVITMPLREAVAAALAGRITEATSVAALFLVSLELEGGKK
ncbi:NUDIX domain-containing protein [Streptomyces sp. NPDC055103]